MKYFFMFDGQGAFKPGYGRTIKNRVFCNELSRVSVAADLDLQELCWGATSGRVPNDSELLQLALFGLCYSLAKAVETETHQPPAWVMGHSLGEISALVYSESISLVEGCQLIRSRGRLMEKAARNFPQDMLVVQYGDRVHLEELCKKDPIQSCFVGNLNSNQQITVAGEPKQLAELSRLLTGLGIKSKGMGSRIGFHSPYLKSIDPEFREEISKIRIGPPRVPFYSVGANKILVNPNEIRSNLLQHLLLPVDWRMAVSELSNAFPLVSPVEVGPSRILKSFWITDFPDRDFFHCSEWIQ